MGEGRRIEARHPSNAPPAGVTGSTGPLADSLGASASQGVGLDRALVAAQALQPAQSGVFAPTSDAVEDMTAFMRCMLRPRFLLAGRATSCEGLHEGGSLTAAMQAASEVTLDFSACWDKLEAMWRVAGRPGGAPSKEQLQSHVVPLRPDSRDGLDFVDVRFHRPCACVGPALLPLPSPAAAVADRRGPPSHSVLPVAAEAAASMLDTVI